MKLVTTHFGELSMGVSNQESIQKALYLSLNDSYNLANVTTFGDLSIAVFRAGESLGYGDNLGRMFL
ncbi:hypothetical protein [Trichormus sp. NMC-1]|uniref:hypothetical protein n=1 Tax=Trichormus sp. NMC-1 TaxID=1853259 RepID=UPI00115FDC2C|nr:hypothetical protein [Trichormus sp. NMC-1]